MSASGIEINLLFILFTLVNLICGGKYTLKPVEIDKSLRVYTDAIISNFDGSNANKPLLMAVKGVVFDVSKGKDFYGKGASYNALIGKDCSRAVAKMSLDPSDLNSDISDLDDETLKSLDEVFTGTYMAKYPVVGYMQYLIQAQRRNAEL